MSSAVMLGVLEYSVTLIYSQFPLRMKSLSSNLVVVNKGNLVIEPVSTKNASLHRLRDLLEFRSHLSHPLHHQSPHLYRCITNLISHSITRPNSLLLFPGRRAIRSYPLTLAYFHLLYLLTFIVPSSNPIITHRIPTLMDPSPRCKHICTTGSKLIHRSINLHSLLSSRNRYQFPRARNRQESSPTLEIIP